MFTGSPSPPPQKKPHLTSPYSIPPKDNFVHPERPRQPKDPPSLLKRSARVSNDSLNPEQSLRTRGAIPPFHHICAWCGCWTNRRNVTFISHLQIDILIDLFSWGFTNKIVCWLPPVCDWVDYTGSSGGSVSDICQYIHRITDDMRARNVLCREMSINNIHGSKAPLFLNLSTTIDGS